MGQAGKWAGNSQKKMEVANEHGKRSLPTLLMMEMQMEGRWRSQFLPRRPDKLKRQNIPR